LAYNHNYRIVCLKTSVTDVTSVTIPHNATPRFRSINFDAIAIDTPLAQSCSSGILVQDGMVQGLWMSYLGDRNQNGHDTEYHLGLHINIVLPVLTSLQQGISPQVKVLGIEVAPVQISQARQMGLSDDWVKRIEDANPERPQVFMIRRVETNSKAEGILKDLDLILCINSGIMTSMLDLDAQYDQETVKITCIREKKIVDCIVPTTACNQGTSPVLYWAGAVIQEPHKAVLQQSKKLPSHLYISARSHGTPAAMYGLAPTCWITHVNGREVITIDDFIKQVKKCGDASYVRVKALTFDLIPMVLAIKQNLHYWPTVLMERDKSIELGWKIDKILHE